MSSRDTRPDAARPIPQGSRAGSGAGSGYGDDDLAYSSEDAAELEALEGWSALDSGEAYVVDTREAKRSAGTARRTEPAAAAAAAARQPTPRTAPPRQPPPRQAAATPADPQRKRRQRRRRIRTILVAALVVFVAWAAFMVWVPINAWNNVTRVDNDPSGDRPADTAGYNYLLVGSDSRDGLTDQQKQELNGEGDAEGKRTDSIILVHVPQGGGKSALISIPRDSYVPIPGHGSNKINASFAFGGPKLLTQTVEQVTGLRVDGYIEIGFAGFAGVVDSLGGVNVCVPFDMKDDFAAIDLKKGCQTLDGPTALGYVRARHSDPRGDIGRAERQRQFLGAVMKKAVQPSTVLIPWRYKAFADAAASGLEVGETTKLTDAVRVLQALRGVDGGDTLSLVVPISNPALQTGNAGVAVKWDTEKALALFAKLKADEPLTVAPAGTTSG